ncbi:hypothetical protein GCM10009734_93570 [Nonomuraea bangladeshensis]
MVRATPAASAICSMLAAGFLLSTRSAAARIVLTVRSASDLSARVVPLIRTGYAMVATQP